MDRRFFSVSTSRHVGLICIGGLFLSWGLAIYLFLKPEHYRAVSQVRVKSLVDYYVYHKGFPDNEIAIIKSAPIIGNAIDHLGLSSRMPFKTRAEMIDGIKHCLNITSIPCKSPYASIEIRVSSRNPTESASIANGIASSYCHFARAQAHHIMLRHIQVPGRLSDEFDQPHIYPGDWMSFAMVTSEAIPPVNPVSLNKVISGSLFFTGSGLLVILFLFNSQKKVT